MGDFDEEVTAFLDPLLLRARARVGQVLDGKWRLDVLLGVGGMAAVYAATHRNGSRAAVKLLHSELATNHDVRSRFLREGYVANSVGHDGAVRVLDDDVDEDGTPFLVTELLDGETLEERRVRSVGTLPEDDVLCIVDQILDVLVAAHEKGVVHRDLKPENVFLTRDGRVKILDFGIARLRAVSTASTATRIGAAMGTPAFMPPEQARGLWDDVDARSDLWAVGAMMFHVLSDRLPHEGRTPNEQLLSAMTNAPPSVASVAPNVSPAVAHLVDRAMAFDRAKRWPDAKRMQDVLRSAYHDRYHVPITTAPRLSVPASVPNRTLASAPGAVVPSLPTTGQPVERPQATGPAQVARWPRGAVIAVSAGAACLSVAVVVAIVASTASHRDHHPVAAFTTPQRESTAPASPSDSTPPTTTASAAISPPPIVSVESLPSAAPATVAPPPPSPRAAVSAAVAPLARPAIKRDPLAP